MGPLCDLCMPRYTYDSVSEVCDKCRSITVAEMVLYPFVVVAIVAAVIILNRFFAHRMVQVSRWFALTFNRLQMFKRIDILVPRVQIMWTAYQVDAYPRLPTPPHTSPHLPAPPHTSPRAHTNTHTHTRTPFIMLTSPPTDPPSLPPSLPHSLTLATHQIMAATSRTLPEVEYPPQFDTIRNIVGTFTTIDFGTIGFNCVFYGYNVYRYQRWHQHLTTHRLTDPPPLPTHRHPLTTTPPPDTATS